MTEQPTAPQYRYYVSYVHQANGGPGFGWSDLTIGQPIRNVEDIKAIQRYLEQANNVSRVTVLGFQRFDA